MRLHKALANLGLGSRRAIETWIKDGKIELNGKVAKIGQEAKPQDMVKMDGRQILLKDAFRQETSRVLLYHKPEGEICSKSSDSHQSVFETLPALTSGRWVMVGRLDVNTSGLLLFTNEGELAHRLMHPSFNIKRQYLVRLKGKVTNAMIERLKTGVELPEGVCRFQEITAKPQKDGVNQWYTVTIMEGKYREVRQLWDSQGCTVSRLIRVKYGNISLPRDLRKGKWTELSSGQVKDLMRIGN